MSLHAGILRGYVAGKKMLSMCDLFQAENTTRKASFSFSKFPVDFISVFQSDDYFQIFNIARINKDYDFLLKDQSFFQFSFDEDGSKIHRIRYAYYEPPSQTKSYEGFLEEIGFSYEECGDVLFQDYEQYLDEAKIKKTITPIRYDYDESLYQNLVHPVSHLHIGHENEIRVPMLNILSPKGFVAFIIRHIYRKQWISSMGDTSFLKVYETIKATPTIHNSFFGDSEKKDFYII